MRGFIVKAGEQVKVIKNGKEWYTENFIDHVTKNETCFFLEEIRVDPLGNVAHGPDDHTIGGLFAQKGYYGFERDGWILLIAHSRVTVI